jgi:hypothetical protein
MVSPSPVNDSFKQARQGSISAIIQVLNDQLSVGGVRTRAMVDNNVLELLCEGAAVSDLDRDFLVKTVQAKLEEISPRNLRRVNIHARIIQEQQLLWLEEIKNDVEKKVLWSEEITLARPNLVKHWVADVKDGFGPKDKAPVMASNRPWKGDRKPNSFDPKRLGWGLLGFLALLGTGWWLLARNGSRVSPLGQASQNALTPTSGTKPSGDQILADPFDRAVNLAGKASAAGTTANRPEDWQRIARNWQEASELMNQVPPGHPRYALAQDRTKTYHNNQIIAQKKSQP